MPTILLSDPAPESQRLPVSALMLFRAFSRIALSSVGSMQFWAQRELVERQRWLTAREFVELLALGQLLPGAGGINLAVLVGYRFAGWSGAGAAVAGFMGWSFLLVIALGMLHQRYGALPLLHQALTGMVTVAVGLLFSSGVKMATILPRRWSPWLFVILAFVGVGVLRWPLLGVLGTLAPCAVMAAWKGYY